MVIQHNMTAMNANRQLGIVGGSLAKSTEKLSSGFRINRAGDDAAGLAISEKMRAQVNGLDQASRNSQDAISLVQTAEGALSETTSILQRMRELAVQSATDTNVTDDREAIQKEINSLTSEINRIGNTTEFNTMKLLDGSKTTKVTTNVVSTAVRTLGTGVTFTTAKTLNPPTGGVTGDAKLRAAFITSAASTTAGIDVTTMSTGNKVTGTITITRTTAGLTVKTEMSDTSLQTLSSVDTVVADSNGNYTYTNHGVEFFISADKYKTITAGASVVINTLGAKVSANNTITTDGPVTSTFTGASSVQIQTSTAGASVAVKSLEFTVVGNGTSGQGTINVKMTLADGTEISDKITAANSAANYTYNHQGTGITLTFTADFKEVGTLSGKYTSISTLKALSTSSKTLTATRKDISTATTTTNGTGKLKFQVGANKGQSMSLGIEDMRADALGLVGKVGHTSTAFVTVKNVSNGTDDTAVEFSLDVSSADQAANAIDIINSAIKKVSGQRADLGAVQNRLEHTIANLDTSAENLQAAESRVRDVDMAAEMMEYSKNNILQQASQSMLAQANKSTQGVLSLLG